MKLFVHLFVLLGFSTSLFAQTGNPADTEVWEPEPPVVTPGEGTDPPSDAIILFDGSDLEEWIVPGETSWKIQSGVVTIVPSEKHRKSPTAIESKRTFGDFQLHLEWRTPAEVRGGGQRRGNSGVIIQGRYEVQVLDNYNNRTYANGQAASVYKQHIPLVNACREPGAWQRYDIVFKAPRFEEDGTLLTPAYVTVLHNGVLVQNHTEIQGSIKFIGLPRYEPHPLKQSLKLQDHGDAVSYRNIWIREL